MIDDDKLNKNIAVPPNTAVEFIKRLSKGTKTSPNRITKPSEACEQKILPDCSEKCKGSPTRTERAYSQTALALYGAQHIYSR